MLLGAVVSWCETCPSSPITFTPSHSLSFPCALRTLMLIYSNRGPSYKEKILEMQKEYDKAMNIARFTLDSDGDAAITLNEQTNVVRTMQR